MATNPGIANLVAYWTLDEAEGAVRVDSHINSIDLEDGPYQGAQEVGQVAGLLNFAADFWRDGKETLVPVGASTLMEGGNIDYSYVIWVKGAFIFGTYGILSVYTPGGEMSHYLTLFNGASDWTFNFCTRHADNLGETILPANTYGFVPQNTWHMIYAGYGFSTSKMYISVNAGPIDEVAQNNGNRAGVGQPFVMGDWRNTADSYCWDGPMDEGCRFNSLLVQDEIDFMYNGGTPPGYAALAGGGAVTKSVRHFVMSTKSGLRR